MSYQTYFILSKHVYNNTNCFCRAAPKWMQPRRNIPLDTGRNLSTGTDLGLCSRDITVPRGNENLSGLHVFKHLRFQKQVILSNSNAISSERELISLYAHAVGDCFWELSERSAREDGAHRALEYWTEILLLLYGSWMGKNTLICVKMSVFASILKHSNSGLKWKQTAEKEYMCNSILHLVI